MFGLSINEWQNLVLSVNVHKKNRRLTPYQTAKHLDEALKNTNIENLATALGFEDATTIRRILKLLILPPELVNLVDWGSRRGMISMSTATELIRLEQPTSINEAFVAAIENEFTKDEAKQLLQVKERTHDSLEECIQRVLHERPKIERSELILGMLITEKAREICNKIGDDNVLKNLKLNLARKFPSITARSLKIGKNRFSLLLLEEDAQKLRSQLNGKKIEEEISELVEKIKID